jgi:hypothetical protein
VAVIDGVSGNHSERNDDVFHYHCSEDKRLYRRVKEIYNDKENENYDELCADLMAHHTGGHNV